ncbi:thrombospondin type 3 repeat-containing protein [Candidatus Parcubacteria bacterium]|nr:thrombospondin type 3 repeat-containing protein [Patescibacteria group bacterium]MBU4309911.1 thrombospondin type 3 repeat-containing protein [Patescibacteria group bacterium]MBU4432541.1 thrombospondin type 3 repeat-containing protein [Patescibacteria group bacterium]MBU4577836.1 thrombospondin type 3 repeat-containing protein [Patescibacteria group bacterium]MCG2696897.1 thrombospondin type 3 repeat-containing protein [Candidatus Parcubacteria bacterium]
MFKKISLLLFSVLFLFGLASFASATTCTSAKVTVIARDQDGEYIPNINFEIYEQVVDVDGNPKPGKKVATGKTSEIIGSGLASFVPAIDTAITTASSTVYALKMWDKNSTLGEFWFYNQIALTCGTEVTVTNVLSGVRLAFYNTAGELLKNIKGSLYTQRFDLENNPIRESQDLLGTFDTSNEGAAYFYLGGKQYDLDNNSSGLYTVEFKSPSGTLYKKFGISLADEKTSYINYVFGEARFNLRDANTNELLPNYKIEIYQQDYDVYNGNKLGTLIKSVAADSRGVVIFESPETIVSVRAKNIKGDYEYFWQKEILDQKRADYDLHITAKNETVKPERTSDSSLIITPIKEIIPQLINESVSESTPEVLKAGKINIAVLDSAGKTVAGKVNVYQLVNISGQSYKKGSKLKTLSLTKATDFEFESGVYLFTITNSWGEYGQAVYIASGESKSIKLRVLSTMAVKVGQIFSVATPKAAAPSSVNGVSSNLLGRILLDVEGNGEAYYVNPDKGQKFYLKDGEVAFKMMRSFGLGISDVDIAKIPVGIDARFNLGDTDGDGLADSLELALGTQPYQKDSDGDGYSDALEVKSGYNPIGVGKLKLDTAMSSKLKGKIVLQVQSKGEAWYINPSDGKRYYMGNGKQAFEIMKYLSLGAKKSVLQAVPDGQL